MDDRQRLLARREREGVRAEFGFRDGPQSESLRDALELLRALEALSLALDEKAKEMQQ